MSTNFRLTCVCGFFVSAFLLFFPSKSLSQFEPLGDVTSVTATNSGATLRTSRSAGVRIEFLSPTVVRIRVAPDGRFVDGPFYALDPDARFTLSGVRLAESQSEITVASPDGTRVVMTRRPFGVKLVDSGGGTLLQSDANTPVVFNSKTGAIEATFLRRSEVETYYGFGEKAFMEMSRNGKFIANWNTDTFSYPIGTDPIYQSIPFFHALYDGKAYGLFLNNTYRTYFDMGKSSPATYTVGADGGELDLYFFTGGKERTPKRVLEDYSQLTGRMPLPPLWSLGNQQSRWSYFPDKRVREIADGFRNNRIPADVIYLDIDYMDEYRVFTWDKERFPDPKKLVSDLKDKGFKTVLIIDPGIKVDPDYSVYAEGRRHGMFVKNPDGSELQRDVWPKASAFPDYTDPKARDWFGGQYQMHLDEGIAGFWNDMNEPGVFMTPETEKPEILHHPAKTFPLDTPHAGDGHPGTHRRYHNVYGMLMARSSFEGLRRLAPQTRPFVLTRAGFAGIQRYAAVWTGDNYASWDHLALSIPMLANMSVSGVPFVGGDVGGFNDMPSAELYARWLQAAALTPFFRSHSVGWVGNKEPWEFGEDFTRINRETVELRYRFLPYLYTQFRQHEVDGSPIMRPLWYEFPNDKLTYLVADQFMVGPDVLVAPVVKEGMRTRGIYLPNGAEWIDWWTGARLESGKTHYLKTPIGHLPLFIRAGAVVPTQSVIQHTGQMPEAEITINVGSGIKPGMTETGKLYQDAGDGYEYRSGSSSETRFEHSTGMLKIVRTGNFKGQRLARIVVHGLAQRPRSITKDGREVEFGYDAATKRAEFFISGNESEFRLVR